MFNTPYEIAFLIIGLFGSLTTIFAFLPQCIKTIRTKDTSGLSLTFFIVAVISSLFWLCLGAMTISSPFILGLEESSIPSSLASGLPPIITNMITLTTNTIIILIKLNNMKQAKKQNITEQQYCEIRNKH